jgi:hypothetical protein
LLIRSWRFWIAVVILGGVFACSSVIVFGTALSDAARQPTREALAAMTLLREVCGGSGLNEARGVQPDAGPHRLVVFRSLMAGEQSLDSFYNRSEDVPAEWRASAPDDTEVVACVHAERILVEECAYALDGGATAVLRREQWLARVVIHDARTGEVIDEGGVEGSLPRECQDEETFPDGQTSQSIIGEQPTPDAIAQWLRPRVAP